MRMRSFGLIVGVGLAIAGSVRAADPTADDLINLAPVVQSSDPKIKSIEMVGTIRLEGRPLRFRALYRAPDHHAILYCDGSDKTPLIFVADKKGLVYDPVGPSVVYLNDCCETVAFESDGNQERVTFGLGRSSAKSKFADVLKLDAKAMCGSKVDEKRVVKDGENQYRLFLIDKDAVSCYSFDTSRPHPFLGFKVFNKDNHEPDLAVEKVVIDGPLADEEFRVPDPKRLGETLNVRKSNGDGISSVVVDLTTILRSAQVRFGVTHPGIRPTRAFASFRKLDWDAIRQHDRKYSAVLRELLPIDRPFVVPELPRTASVPVTNARPASR